MDWRIEFSNWLTKADEQTKADLSVLTEAQLRDRFKGHLTFGTGGLRGELGAGSNNMNVYVVRRATR